MNREDFVTIRLSEAGCAAARGPQRPGPERRKAAAAFEGADRRYSGPRAEPCVRVAGGGSGADSRGYEFEFVPDELKDVTRPEWQSIFEPLRNAQGQPLFEIVERPAPAAAENQED